MPLALTLLAPILVNIVAFHVLLAPVLVAVPMIFLALELYMAWAYRGAFGPMLRVNTTPTQRSRQ